MTNGGGLDRLSDLAGIEPDYYDIWGNHHRISDLGRRAILGALGLSAADDQAIETSIRALENESWNRWLPPVVIAYEDEVPEFPLTLPGGRAEWPVTLQLTTEDGTRSDIVFRLTEAHVNERRAGPHGELCRFMVRSPAALPAGYHWIRPQGRPDQAMRLIVAPRQCYLPKALQGGGKLWGLSAQLYSLRRPDNWGIGDFTDLLQLVDAAAQLGAGVVGLNPLHALFLTAPEAASPYSPSSRNFLNVLYIDIEKVVGYADCKAAQAAAAANAAELKQLRASDIVAYRKVKALKLPVLEALFENFRSACAAGKASAAAADFDRFRAEQGEPLRRFALFEALAEKFAPAPWQQWPEGYRRPDSPVVATFAKDQAARIEFYEFLQWQADGQLAAAQARAKEYGQAVGIYRDLAVGAARDGADAWSDQATIVQNAKVGCPPDPFNMLGQDWGIPPFHPRTLREQGYQPFIDMLRANMRHAGALRIDHVMGLMHLFWIPSDGRPADGAYVKYPFDEMLAILALESQRNRCLVVGEDLGTVPPGFREQMAAINVLSYRVLYFEKDGDRFKQPDEYPALALACVTTHDLATLAGFWNGADLDLKRQLQLYPTEDAANGDHHARVHDRYLMLTALASQGLLPAGHDPNNVDGSQMTPELIAALHGYLALSPSSILLVQVDDLMQETDQINLPGTVDERPNWRRRLSTTVDKLRHSPVVRALAPTLTGR